MSASRSVLLLRRQHLTTSTGVMSGTTEATSPATAAPEVKMVELKINDQTVSVPAGTSILHASQKVGVNIPTLCYHPTLPVTGSCRICLCKIKSKNNKLVPACATPVESGMEIEANSPELDASVKNILELILTRHPDACATCEANGRCDLQNLFYRYQIDNKYPKTLDEVKAKCKTIDLSSPSIVIDPSKCILCMRCVKACSYLQDMNILGPSGRGQAEHISTVDHVPLAGTQCISCGACTRVCPTGAIMERPHIHAVEYHLNHKATPSGKKIVIVQTAPSVRVAIAEELGMDSGGVKTGQMVAALRKLGFDYVYDTNVAADLTTIEEANELVHRIVNKGVLPMFTSCCPAWVNMVEQTYPELIPHLSSCRSPQQMLGSLVKTSVAKQLGVTPDKIIHVSVMPCVAKKGEAARPEFRKQVEGKDYSVPDVDYVLTTRELGHMLRVANIHTASLKESAFDSPMGSATEAGGIFGATGGVMEAALRTAHSIVTGKKMDRLEYHQVRGLAGIKEAEIPLGDVKVKVAVANGGAAVRHVVEQIKAGKCEYHFVEMMACPGGCIGGGGMPKSQDPDILKKRSQAIYTESERATLRFAHESPEVKRMYDEVLHEPNSHKAHELLHTHYHDRSKDHGM